MKIEQAQMEDAAVILALQKLCYRSEAELHDDFTIPPLKQTLEEIQTEFAQQVVLKAVIEGQVIGSVRAYMRGENCSVGKLIVHPNYQNRGIGTRLMYEIERRFPAAQRFELFTGHKSQRNLHLYGKLGYTEFKRQSISDKLTLIFMKKRRI
jgi:ribosomal protein S18 acetylase RimI-like enzyme